MGREMRNAYGVVTLGNAKNTACPNCKSLATPNKGVVRIEPPHDDASYLEIADKLLALKRPDRVTATYVIEAEIRDLVQLIVQERKEAISIGKQTTDYRTVKTK